MHKRSRSVAGGNRHQVKKKKKKPLGRRTTEGKKENTAFMDSQGAAQDSRTKDGWKNTLAKKVHPQKRR